MVKVYKLCCEALRTVTLCFRKVLNTFFVVCEHMDS